MRHSRTTLAPLLIVVTGGPGAGKTSVLALARSALTPQVEVLPEAAGIVFGGGFPREQSVAGQKAVQRAIFHVQRELERMAIESEKAPVILCDRGTIDGSAYWPGAANDFFRALHTSRKSEISRYHAVIQLRTPIAGGGYNHANPLRIETSEEAALIDEKILKSWEIHPHRYIIPRTPVFIEKADQAINLIRELISVGTLRRRA